MRAAIGLLGALVAWVVATPSCLAALKIASVSYDTHFLPTESVEFNVAVFNSGSTSVTAEVDIALTNVDTERERTLSTPAVLVADNSQSNGVPAGGTKRMTHSGGSSIYSLSANSIGAGTYTVSFVLFDANGIRRDHVSGPFPLHVGTETESISVFPQTIHLGVLPPGRTMHPTPIEVSWNFFRFNRLRLDDPFSIRVYTDNASRYRGIPQALQRGSPAGLVSLDGKYLIPLKVWNLNYGPELEATGWDVSLAGPPPVDDDAAWLGPPLLEGKRHLDAAAWVRIPDFSEMTSHPSSWRRLIGQDITDSRFVGDTNSTGDFTLRSPFTFYLATDAGSTAVEGSYSTTLVVELWSP